MTRVMGYKMTNDSGFAPNPFFGLLTLATCKPGIRRTRKRDDYVAGFASKELVRVSQAHGPGVPYMGLIYLMQVTEDPMPLGRYFLDPRFSKKKPDSSSRSLQRRCGDNIYAANRKGGYIWQENAHHSRDSLAHDTRGRNALISSKFWYFGRNAFVPEEGWDVFLRGRMSEARTFYCPDSFLQKILSYFDDMGFQPGVQGDPCIWPPLRAGSRVGSGCGD